MPEIFINIPTAAKRANLSLRQFRRNILSEHVPIMKIGRKHFILVVEYEKWEKSRSKNTLP